MAKSVKKTVSRNTKANTKRTATTRNRKPKQSWWQQRAGILFIIGFALVASLLVVSSLAKTPAVKDLEARQKSELRALKASHEEAEDIKDDQCDAMSGDQEDICEDELKILKDENEIEEDNMKAAHKAAVKALKASESTSGNNTGSTNNNSGSGSGNTGGTNGQTGAQGGGNGGAGGAGGNGSCTGSNCSGSAGSNGTGAGGTAGTSNPGTSNPGSAGQAGNSSAAGSSGGGSASSAAYSVRIRTAGAGNRCLDVVGSGTANGTPVILYDCHPGANQRWIAANGELRSVHSGKCLDVNAIYGGRNNSPVQIWDCHQGPNQKWDGSSNSTGSQLASRASGRCLDAAGPGTANGTQIIVWDCHDGLNQRWIP